MHVLEADVNFLADRERHGIHVARRAHGFDRERRRTGPLRTRERFRGAHLEAQPLVRAHELELGDFAHSDHGHGQRSRIGASTTSSGRTTTAASSPLRNASDQRSTSKYDSPSRTSRYPYGPSRRFAPPEERGDEARAGPLIQCARLADFLEPAAVHDADSVRHAERFFLIVRHEHRRDADRTLNLTDRAP